MRNVTLKNLLDHKLRLALTSLAVVLGVTFIAGTFVLTDTLHSTFTNLFGTVYQKIDFQVRGVAQFPSTAAANAVRNPVPESLLGKIRRQPGVEAADGNVEGYAQFVGRDGSPISTGGAPTLGIGFNSNSSISNLRLVQGRPPTNSHEVVMDAGTAKKHHFNVGDRVRILTVRGSHVYTITGIAKFGTINNLAGSTIAAFSVPTAQRLVNEVGQFDFIDIVTKPGVDKAAVQHRIASILPRDVEVVTGQTVVLEQTSAVSQSLSFLTTILLIFALISLFVGSFTIFNTFSITVRQRTRDLALLRVVGASRRQVFRSVLAEAALVGTFSSLVGLGLGVLAALALQGLLRAVGITLPRGPLVFEARTVIVSLAVGIGVTVVSAIGPARRAVRIPPIAALSDRPTGGELFTRRQMIRGAVVTLVGVVLLVAGLAGSTIVAVGVGAAVIFIGVAMLAPAVARPVSGAIGRPLARAFGVPGKLGRRNSMRSPRRTAQTASALMVGLALVSAISVFGASTTRSVTSTVDQAIRADILITASGGGLSKTVPGRVAAVPGVKTTAVVYRDQFEFQHSIETLTGGPDHGLGRTVILQMTSGSVDAMSRGQLLIDTTTANTRHLAVGDRVSVKFAATGRSTIRIGGIYKSNRLIGSFLVGDSYFSAHFQRPNPGGLLVLTNGSSAVFHRVNAALRAYPNLNIQTRAQFEKSELNSLNQLLNLVYVLLALAVLIALLGIVNTLMLSVFERTHEIGLLRAVGMRRRQVRRMIRSEAVILAMFGALIGIVVGTGLGLALVASLRQQGITDMVVPAGRLVVLLVVSGVLGVVAATWPARRAAKLDVLAAIATE